MNGFVGLTIGDQKVYSFLLKYKPNFKNASFYCTSSRIIIVFVRKQNKIALINIQILTVIYLTVFMI